MKQKLFFKTVSILLVFIMVASIAPLQTAFALQPFEVLNPLGTIVPRRDIPLASRQGVVDILEGTGERTLRLGVTWYMKPLDGEPAVALGEMLRDYWEALSADPYYTNIPEGLTVQIVRPLTAISDGFSSLPTSSDYISPVGHAWNNRADMIYDHFAENLHAIIMGVGD